jgi:NAD+ diphosphatase
MTDTASRPGFSSFALDRCDDLRSDPHALAELLAHPAARQILLRGLDPVGDGAQLARVPLAHDARLDTHILLGKDDEGAPLFVALGPPGLPHGGQFAPRVWEMAAELGPEELSLYGCARSLVDWHARHGFCAVCGAPTALSRAGWGRRCPSCNAEHFPRVDPVVIMLAEHDGRVLLGRQPRFPPRRFSALAGFVEPGETLEGAVARELYEEAGIRVRNVRYVMSQPWPFPSSLMIAATAEAEDDVITLDEKELEHAFWASADDVRAAMAGDPAAPFIAPPPMAVAHHLLRHWVESV